MQKTAVVVVSPLAGFVMGLLLRFLWINYFEPDPSLSQSVLADVLFTNAPALLAVGGLVVAAWLLLNRD
jgi:hypothetical protein